LIATERRSCKVLPAEAMRRFGVIGMKTRASLVLVLATALSFVLSGAAVAPSRVPATVDRGPYVQGTTRSEVTIVWRTTAPTDSVVAYGSGTLASCAGDPLARETAHAVTVTGLAAGTTYTYTVSVATGATHTFTTAPAPGAPFTALVFGDSGQDTPEQFALARRLVLERSDLVLHTGDVIYPAGEASGYDPLFFAPYGALLASVPIFPVIGNHDLHAEEGKPYRDVFHVRANNAEADETYYSFEWGNTKFISIESCKRFRRPGPHMRWLEEELASNRCRWLVVAMHVPLYSLGEHGDDPELQANLEPLFSRYRVDLLLSGHDHIYERGGPVKVDSTDPSWPGLRYFVTGGGGAALSAVLGSHPWPSVARSEHHYLVLTFLEDAIVGHETRLDGTTGDSFRLEHY
jgi:predicted phosphodiesterase